MEKTYEKQIIKWAAKKYCIPMQDISSVDMEASAYSYGGCPTCGSETIMEVTIHVRGQKENRYGTKEIIKTDNREIGWNMDLSNIVQEIFEA